MKTKRKEIQVINAGSMADIAFLLLIFFLVTTTLLQEKGLGMALPAKQNQPPPVEVSSRNLFNILINEQNQVLVQGERAKVSNLSRDIQDFVTNPSHSLKMPESPEKAIILIKMKRNTHYKTYLQVLDEVKKGYYLIRASYLQIGLTAYIKQEEDMKKFVPSKKFQEAKKKFPMNITEQMMD